MLEQQSKDATKALAQDMEETVMPTEVPSSKIVNELHPDDLKELEQLGKEENKQMRDYMRD